ILAPEDNDAAALLTEQLTQDGVVLKLRHKALRFEGARGEQQRLVCDHEGNEVSLEFDRVIVAMGRQANLKGFGLEELEVETGKTINTNELLQTNFPSIYACGDVVGPYQFTHVASHQAWYAAVNA